MNTFLCGTNAIKVFSLLNYYFKDTILFFYHRGYIKEIVKRIEKREWAARHIGHNQTSVAPDSASYWCSLKNTTIHIHHYALPSLTLTCDPGDGPDRSISSLTKVVSWIRRGEETLGLCRLQYRRIYEENMSCFPFRELTIRFNMQMCFLKTSFTRPTFLFHNSRHNITALMSPLVEYVTEVAKIIFNLNSFNGLVNKKKPSAILMRAESL